MDVNRSSMRHCPASFSVLRRFALACTCNGDTRHLDNEFAKHFLACRNIRKSWKLSGRCIPLRPWTGVKAPIKRESEVVKTSSPLLRKSRVKLQHFWSRHRNSQSRSPAYCWKLKSSSRFAKESGCQHEADMESHGMQDLCETMWHVKPAGIPGTGMKRWNSCAAMVNHGRQTKTTMCFFCVSLSSSPIVFLVVFHSWPIVFHSFR